MTELPKAQWPQWLRHAHTVNAVVEGTTTWPIWRGGEFRGGEFRGGVFRGGEFSGGVFRGGVFRGGVFRGGVFSGGEFRDGEFRGGEFSGGEFSGGVWKHPHVKDRAAFMASLCGIALVGKMYVGYRSTNADGTGRWEHNFIQKAGKHTYPHAPAGEGTCVKGIHVASAAAAYQYFGIDPKSQLWEVKFTRRQLLDCDGQKARISGGVFKKIKWPW